MSMTDEEAQKQAWRNSEYRRLKAETAALLAEYDARRAEHKDFLSTPEAWSNLMLAERRELTNVISPVRKPAPAAARARSDSGAHGRGIAQPA